MAQLDERTAAASLTLGEFWVERLGPKLATQAGKVALYTSYYDGDHPLPEIADEAKRIRYQAKFAALMKESRTNWMKLVVEAVQERLRVNGVRFGDDPAGNDAAETIWQRNHLDKYSAIAHREALKTGQTYVSVWPARDNSDLARIQPESPAQVIVEHDPEDMSRRLAALKQWTGADDKIRATVYLPDQIIKLQKNGEKWESRGDDWLVSNPYGVVPIVPFYTAQDLYGRGHSEMEGHLPIQDRINRTIFARLVAADFQATGQRWATGIGFEEDTEGNLTIPFDSAFDRMFVSEEADAKFGQFVAADLSGFINSVEADVQHLAALTRTPPHYLLGQSGSFPSGESLDASETGLLSKTNERQTGFGESWEEVIRLAFQVEGSDLAGDVAAETIWKNAKSRSEAQVLDAAVKRRAISVPLTQVWEDVGYSPTQIKRFPALLAAEALQLDRYQAE